MSANSGGQVGPRFDLRNYSPKTKRPNLSPKCLTCSGSLAARNRSARSKNSRSFRWRVSLPCSVSSTRIRLWLRRRCFAFAPTFPATSGGRVTLPRTSRPEVGLVTAIASYTPYWCAATLSLFLFFVSFGVERGQRSTPRNQGRITSAKQQEPRLRSARPFTPSATDQQLKKKTPGLPSPRFEVPGKSV